MVGFLNILKKYNSHNWYIFPCREKPSDPFINKNGKLTILKEKSPYISGGFKSATLDFEQIKKWWIKWPEAAIGIDCGRSNLFVVDVDTKNGRTGIDNYFKLGISDSGALHSKTPSGGLHIVFKGSGKTSTNVIQGIDTRAENGYFIAPPSKIITGNYTALDDWNRDPVEISEDVLRKLHAIKKINKPKEIFFNPELLSDINIEKVRQALFKLPMRMCDSEHEWIVVGMSLYQLGEKGLALWDEWSRRSKSYEEGCCIDAWEKLKPPDEITLGSLFFWANNEVE